MQCNLFTLCHRDLYHALTETGNKPKRPKTSQNDVKWPKILKLGKSQILYWFSFIKLQGQMPKFKPFGPKSITFLIFKDNPACTLFRRCWSCFPKFWAQRPKFGHFGLKLINVLILTKFPLYPISQVLISNLTFVFQNFEPKCPNVGLLVQKVLTF